MFYLRFLNKIHIKEDLQQFNLVPKVATGNYNLIYK